MSDCFIGEIRLFAGSYNPQNWVMCNGQSMQVSQNEVLYALLGTTYGGDGRTNFNIPDLRGRVPICQGAGVGLANRVLGATGGMEIHTLGLAEMPPHTHPVYATTSNATGMTPGQTVVYGQVGTPTSTQYGLYNNTLPPTTTVQGFDVRAVQSVGSSQPHGNCMYTTAISFIMAIVGIFPSRPN